MRIISEKGTYRAPEQLTVELNEQRRKEKEAVAEERERLVKRVSYDMPRAAKERVEAIVFKTLQEKKHIEEMEPIDPELTLRPDTTKTLR